MPTADSGLVILTVTDSRLGAPVFGHDCPLCCPTKKEEPLLMLYCESSDLTPETLPVPQRLTLGWGEGEAF